MKVVLSWLRELCLTDLAAEELGELLTRKGAEVESIERPWAGLTGVIVARVLEVRDHPNSGTLCIARVQTGSGEQEIVVGVRNMGVGDLVPLAPPGARIPMLPEPLGAREIRGVTSNGMLCAPDELGISASHEGILILPPELEPGCQAAVSCFLCDGVGCRVCGNGWLELLGAGMVHPRVLENCGYDAERYTGFAFGMGVERVAMVRFGVGDMRLLVEGDVRFLEQFEGVA